MFYNKKPYSKRNYRKIDKLCFVLPIDFSTFAKTFKTDICQGVNLIILKVS